MEKDNSKNNFDYPGLSIDKIVANSDEYIVPECIEACKKFWEKNIFTESCSNRDETKDKDGNIRKYIMVSNLSRENEEIFNNLVKSKPNNYQILKISDKKHYVIVILSKDNIQDREKESQKLLGLVSPFKMQDCLEGFISIKDYYLKNIMNYSYISNNISISISEAELIAAVKKHLSASGKLDLLDIDRGVIYISEFYKKAHQKYLKMQQQDSRDSEDLDIVDYL